MYLKYFYDPDLAQASYLIGCQQTGEAMVIDPARRIEPYLAAAADDGFRIVGAAETHIHADFVSGSRELADRMGATLYLSDEGSADWKYQFAQQYSAKLLKNGDFFYVGKVRLGVLHTPGHTPESISFVLTDEGGGVSEPMGIFTGDFVFVGSIGRPDLLETAAGVSGSAVLGAKQLYQSMRRFLELPDYLQVWPAHGAGSACGKGLGAIPSSTVGYEKRFNPALQYQDQQKFVDYILADQPETPFYFGVMKHVNKVGPELLHNLPAPAALPPDELARTASSQMVIDTSAAAEFSRAHVPKTINIPAPSLAQWAGFLADYDRPTFLLTDASQLPSILCSLRSIGIDNVGGYFEANAVRRAELRSEAYESVTPCGLQPLIQQGAVTLLDVRSATEFEHGHIAGAQHCFLGQLARELNLVERERPVVVQCQGGGRSAIAASLLQRAGYRVTNLQGGYRAWQEAGLPTVAS